MNRKIFNIKNLLIFLIVEIILIVIAHNQVTNFNQLSITIKGDSRAKWSVEALKLSNSGLIINPLLDTKSLDTKSSLDIKLNLEADSANAVMEILRNIYKQPRVRVSMDDIINLYQQILQQKLNENTYKYVKKSSIFYVVYKEPEYQEVKKILKNVLQETKDDLNNMIQFMNLEVSELEEQRDLLFLFIDKLIITDIKIVRKTENNMIYLLAIISGLIMTILIILRNNLLKYFK
jgi:hypothetical protein